MALHGFFTAKAEQKGLDSAEGLKLLEVAARESQRAERTLVTVHDLARIHAQKSRAAVNPHEALFRIAAEEEAKKGQR
jgi:hypothetical protein